MPRVIKPMGTPKKLQLPEYSLKILDTLIENPELLPPDDYDFLCNTRYCGSGVKPTRKLLKLLASYEEILKTRGLL